MPKPIISGQSPAVAFTSVRSKLAKVVTRNFYNSHIALVDSPNFNEHLGDAKRPIEASSCMILTRADVGRFVAMVKARRQRAINPGPLHPDRSAFYDSGQQFDFMCWKEHGKGERVRASFTYSMLREGGVWYVHHLESVGPHAPTGGVLSPSELEHDDEPDDAHSSDGYETDESFDELRSMYGDDD